MALPVEYQWCNPIALREARTRLRLSLDNVVSQWNAKWGDEEPLELDVLESWEEGKSEPELTDLEFLSELYVCPVGWFFLDHIPREIAKLDFRGVKSAGITGAGQQAVARFLADVEWIEAAAAESGTFPRLNLGSISLEDVPSQIARAERERLGFSESIRSNWASPEDAFRWWRVRIESLGVFCLMGKLPAEEIRGASFRASSGAGYILVNSEDGEYFTGRTFTLLHEYVHLLLGSDYVCDFLGSQQGSRIEQFANAVAASILVTQAEIWDRLRELKLDSYRDNWADAALRDIASPFKVSKDVVLIFLEQMDLTPRGHYWGKQSAWKREPRTGKGWARPKTIARRTLDRFGNTFVRTALDPSLSIPPVELAEVLNIKVERLADLRAELASQIGD